MEQSNNPKTREKQHREFPQCCVMLELMHTHGEDGGSLYNSQYKDDVSESSFHRTFDRDRKALAREGIYLKEERISGGSSKRWKIDEAKTFASVENYSKLERRTTATLLDALINNPETLNTGELADCIAKIGQGLCDIPQEVQNDSLLCPKTVLETVKQALYGRIPLNLKYRNSKHKKCIFYPYGMFSLGRYMYVVGLRTSGEDSAIRTYNLQRINERSLKLLEKKEPYSIPADFNIDKYYYLPFEIGTDERQSIRLYIDKRSLTNFTLAVHGRGQLEKRDDGSAIWSGEMVNTAMAASWCIENDAIPLGPDSLVDAWTALNEEAKK